MKNRIAVAFHILRMHPRAPGRCFALAGQAILAARRIIVEGAVGMVEHALKQIGERGFVALDDKRKVAMDSNLLVMLC